MIGTHYSEDFNCAHFVVSWLHENHGITVPIVSGYEMSFMMWLRRHCERVQKPSEGCIVRMVKDGAAHVGVYTDHGVMHNYKPYSTPGSVVHWCLGVTKRNYDRVEFWQWSKSHTTKT